MLDNRQEFEALTHLLSLSLFGEVKDGNQVPDNEMPWELSFVIAGNGKLVIIHPTVDALTWTQIYFFHEGVVQCLSIAQLE